MKLTCQKELYTIDESIHYLNCAYMSPLLKSSEEAGIKGILAKRNPQGLGTDGFFNDLKLLRSAIAQLIHTTQPNNIAIVPAASYGLANAARNVQCKPGQDIIVVKDEFPSNYYIWKRLCEEKGLNLITIEPDESAIDKATSWNNKIIAAINENTAIVALEHTHWMNGTRFDLERISQAITAQDTYLIVDGTQSVGMLDIDVTALKIDALVCAGYKWLMGPYSIGFAYYSDRLTNGTPIEENWINKEGSHQFAELTNYTSQYREGAIKYDGGETSNFILVPMFLAAINQLLEWGIVNMHNYVTELTKPFVGEMRERKLIASNDTSFSPHLLGVEIPLQVDAKALSESFAKHHVFTSVRGHFLRVSTNVYNTKEDLEVLQKLLLKQL